ncbi:TonB-dependent receptor [Flammeovirga sp. EKP202]|nr:TonB-dependent receptor [Flammeovirga sp. EKP202]
MPITVLMKWRILLLSMMGVFLWNTAIAQQQEQITISGTVKDPDGIPVIGANIIIAGSTTGTMTNFDGGFKLGVPANSKIIVTSIGYEDKIVNVGTSTELHIVLIEAQEQLNEVVIIGYGTQKKADLTGAVATVDAEVIAERKTPQLSQALQGSIPGVTVTRDSGAPGSTGDILIRGQTTLNNSSPLVMIDGAPGDIDDVDPEDVQSLTVLKDAASAAIYGSRAAAGVIIITTKRAKEGELTVTYSGDVGIQRPTTLPEMVGVQDYFRMQNEYKENDGLAPLWDPYYIDNYRDNSAVNPDLYPNTDWQGELLKNNAVQQRHNFSIAGGNDVVRSKMSFGYSSQEGLIPNYNWERYTLQLNNNIKINNKLKGALDMYLRQSNKEQPNEGHHSNSFYSSARTLPSFYPAYWSDGTFADGKDGQNPVAFVNKGGYKDNQTNFARFRARLDFEPIKDLTVSAQLAPKFNFNNTKSMLKVIDYYDLEGNWIGNTGKSQDKLTDNRKESYSINQQYTITYNKKINKHSFSILAGYESNYYREKTLEAERIGFVLPDYDEINAGNVDMWSNKGGQNENALSSLFARVSYNYKNRYYVQSNIRYDGSSRFHPDHRWGFFPSVSAGWNISNEEFLNSVDWLSNLKVRGSWGRLGNQRVGNYAYTANMSRSNSYVYAGGEVVPLTSYAQQDMAIENITWETTEGYDFGFDAAFLDDRLNVNFDWYYKTTYDILLKLDIPLYLGYANPPLQNAGVVDNQGWEISMSWRDIINDDLTYSIGFNLSDNKNTVVDMKGANQLGNQVTMEGQEYKAWYGYENLGYFGDDHADHAKLTGQEQPGDIRYKKQPGGESDMINAEEDRVVIGSSLPRYTFGANFNVNYKNLDFGLVLQGVGKTDVMLSNAQVQPFSGSFRNYPAYIAGNYWTPENTGATYPRLSDQGSKSNYQKSDFWLVNGAYMRIKNITLGYTLPKSLLKKVGVKKFRIYASVNDLWSFNHMPKGWDPEISSSDYPLVTTYMTGVSLKF